GTTTVKRGTLALRSGVTLARSKAIRLTSAGAKLDVGTAGLRVATSLSGKGTVKGSVTNQGEVAGGLAVTGDYAQSAKGRLALRDRPLKVSGKVGLAGKLDLSGVGAKPPRKINVLDHKGGAKTTGAFTGLREGAEVKLGGTTYRISYRGGDGNDVLLTAATAAARASASAHADAASPGAAAEITTENASSADD
ncbi:autotransporter, partial [Streptomyces sp. MCAF7]